MGDVKRFSFNQNTWKIGERKHEKTLKYMENVERNMKRMSPIWPFPFERDLGKRETERSRRVLYGKSDTLNLAEYKKLIKEIFSP